MTTVLLFLLAVASLATPRRVGGAPESSTDAWLSQNSFMGWNDCLAVFKDQSLRVGDRLILFELDQPARPIEISGMSSGEWAERMFRERGFGGVYEDSVLWDSIGCYWGLQAEGPSWVARWKPSPTGEGLPMAIRGIPKDARVVGGKGVRLRPAELTKLAMRVRPRLSRRFDGPDILLSGLRFEQVNGVGITRLFLGRPFYRRTGTGAPIDSIQICEAFVDGDSLLATEEYSRVSGELERAETEPPELDVENWHEVQRQTIGFFRLERDKAWRHLTVDVGFEGINWMVVGLSPGMPIQQHYYLYTSH